MYRVAVVSLALDIRDPELFAALAALAPAAGIRRVVLAHVHAQDADPLLGGTAMEVTTFAAPDGVRGRQAELQALLPDVEILGVHSTGRPGEEIGRIAKAEDADLVVIGRRTSGWAARGREIARGVGRSVLVVPQKARVNLDEVMVPVDFTQHSIAALSTGMALGRRVRAVYAHRLAAPGAEGLKAKAEGYFAREVLPVLPQSAREPILDVVAGETIDDALRSHVGEAGLIVMGARGTSSRPLGPTAEDLAGVSPVPVLLVRAKGEA